MTVEKLEKDIKLVQECIMHWDRVIQRVDRPDAQSCSLCREYLPGGCMKCPIYEETGQFVCHKTPYQEALAECYNSSSVRECTRMRDFLCELESTLYAKLDEAQEQLSAEKVNAQISKLDKDIRLLDECIVHWQAVLKGEEEPSGSKCALCREYNRPFNCNGCPIEEQKRKDAEICRQWERQDVKADCCDAAQDECCMSLAALIEEQP